MSDERFCDETGLLVGAESRLSADLSDCYVKGRPIIGCNRLYCSQCASWVRNVAGVRRDEGHLGRTELAELYAAIGAGASPLPYVTTNMSGELYRVYVCLCGWDHTSGIRNLYASDRDLWRCAGHPIANTPA